MTAEKKSIFSGNLASASRRRVFPQREGQAKLQEGASTEMIKGILGRKLGMTQVFEQGGIATGVTVIEAGPCVVTQVKTPERDGYYGVQVGWGDAEARQLSQSEQGHLRKRKLPLVRHVHEIPVDPNGDRPKVGQRVDVSMFAEGD